MGAGSTSNPFRVALCGPLQSRESAPTPYRTVIGVLPSNRTLAETVAPFGLTDSYSLSTLSLSVPCALVNLSQTPRIASGVE